MPISQFDMDKIKGLILQNDKILEVRRSTTLNTDGKVKCYLVGGTVRDYARSAIAMERSSINDYDFVLDAPDTVSIVKAFADKINGHFLTLHSQLQIYRVVSHDKKDIYDFSTLLHDTIEEDLLSRDLTINSIAYDIENGIFIDPADGLRDISRHLLRLNKLSNVLRDPLRLLRVVRTHTAYYKYTSQPGTYRVLYELIKHNPDILKKVSKERIQQELIKMFSYGNAGRVMDHLIDIGIFYKIFPDIDEDKFERVEKDIDEVTSMFSNPSLALSCILYAYPTIDMAKAWLAEYKFPKKYQYYILQNLESGIV